MRDLFPGFYKRTDEELSKLWQEGVFVFDTNMLLNVYRYTQEARARFFEILDLLKKRNQLWIPYQAAYEYQDRRIDVIQGQLDAYEAVSNILHATGQKLESLLEPYKSKHGFIDTSEIAKEITDAIKSAKATVTSSRGKDKKELEALKNDDKHLAKIEELFQGNIGSPYDSSKLEEMYRRSQLRVELKLPPGWVDADKVGFKKYGDVILWFQIVDFARSQKKPIIFVTDDGKKDWWLPDVKSQGSARPQPELVQEMFVEAGVLLHMYKGYEFLEQAEIFLKLEEKPGVIEEAKEVTEQNTLELYLVKQSGISFDTLYGYEAERAILAWLKETHPQSEIITNALGAPDFIIQNNLDGTRTGYVVKFLGEQKLLSPFFGQNSILSAMTKSFSTVEELRIDKLVIFIVANTLRNALVIAENVISKIPIPENVSLIIGHLNSARKFTQVASLPSEE